MLWSRRVVRRLRAAEAREPDPWLRDDLEIARLTVTYAASGEAVCCSPHVLASYRVLGLHPEKVWPAILKRREARGPLEASEAPPRKPAQSVKLWSEKTNAVRAAIPYGAEAVILCDHTISVPMAAPNLAAAYPNSGDSGSRKERPFFSVAEIEKFFETCPEEILSRRERLFLHGVWKAAGRPFGSDIQFFKAVKDYKQACFYRSETTARLNLRHAERRGLLEVAHRNDRGECHHIWIRPRTERDRGLYRRVTTHRLPIGLLLRWRNGSHGQVEVMPSRKPTQPVPPDPPPATAAPKKVAETPSTRRITRDERLVLHTAYIALRKNGLAEAKALDEVARQYQGKFERADVELAIKGVIERRGDYREPPPEKVPPKCFRCSDQGLIFNYGPGKRLVPCPDCGMEAKE